MMMMMMMMMIEMFDWLNMIIVIITMMITVIIIVTIIILLLNIIIICISSSCSYLTLSSSLFLNQWLLSSSYNGFLTFLFYSHFTSIELSPEVITSQWFLTLYTYTFPVYPSVLSMWDYIFSTGWEGIYMRRWVV